MAHYVDGFVLTVPKKNIGAYKKMAKSAGRVWMKCGAIEYRECMGDHMNTGVGLPFPKLAKAGSSEVVFFSFIVYKSRAHRDSVNKKVMNHPYMKSMKPDMKMPFDMKKMAYGGFKTIVDLE